MSDEKKRLSVADLAERYGVSVATIHAWNYQHSGPPRMRLGKRVFYRLDDVLAWEEAHMIRDDL
ncbi:helix-turn-helix transcriptional regulator [Streptomyces stackebrandtii]|uniref:helix-turn-helix transcriptional regulator n=1 Tax=Streptomyces stackebrandtii TaxID=3051177 RepID=UPI0028DBE4AA|nr:helix-turn-helix domain-containing protein [Streptomyces sp. DSM 40976]